MSDLTSMFFSENNENNTPKDEKPKSPPKPIVTPPVIVDDIRPGENEEDNPKKR